MSDTIVIRGFTASNPTLAALPNGVPVVNFRLASTPRWQDSTGTWKEGTTNWYTIKAYRRLAQNIAASVQKGQPLVVSGRQGAGVRETFTVRKVSFGVGVERTFPVHSPSIEKIEVVTRGDVRRAKLYYMRDRHGKAARIREKREF